MLSLLVVSLAFAAQRSYSVPAPAYVPAPLPPGWWSPTPCSQDDGDRVFYNVLTTMLANNTPSVCIEYCDALEYDFAGVEYTSQCFCGTDFENGTPQYTVADPSKCYLPCAGDPEYTCGGNWYVQLYERSKPAITFPRGWSVARACAIDVPDRILANDVIFLLPNNTPTSCMQRCDSLGYTFAGVEYGDECHCGTGLVGNPEEAYTTLQCLTPCAGSRHYYCGGFWRMQVYSSIITS